MARQLTRGRGRGTPYNPLVSDVMERVYMYGPTAGEDRPLGFLVRNSIVCNTGTGSTE